MAAQKQNFLAQLVKSHDYDQGEVYLRNASSKRHVLSKEVLEYAFSNVANNANNSYNNNDRIRKVYFMAYNFTTLPDTPIIGDTYSNLRHLDIRDNDEFNDIGPILRHVPNLTSLNISDCRSLTSLLPIAMETRRDLALKNLWVRGTNLADMTVGEWEGVFRALAQSSGPMERLALCRNQMLALPCSIVLLCSSLTYLFVEDMPGIVIPEVIGSMRRLRYLSLAGNDLKRLPRTIGRLGNGGVGGSNIALFEVNLNRNPNLISPPAEYQHSIEAIRKYWHTERMFLLRGLIRLYPHMRRARLRANERMFRPNGSGYWSSKERFERRQSSQQLDEEIENGLG